MNLTGLPSHCTLVGGWLEEKLGMLYMGREGTKQSGNFARKVVVMTPVKPIGKISSFLVVHRT